MSVSLWLTPSPKDAAFLQALIQRCAQSLGGPKFPPHVTLCSDVRAPTVEALGSALQHQVTLLPPTFGDDYFHACYLPLAEDGQLRALQARWAAQLGGKVPTRHPLHLSLAYGALTEESRQIIRSLELPATMPVRMEGLELWDTSGDVASWRRWAG